eukprot:m.69744 g.69744  ORF g.69744 m.69744 type:complete len:362 (+) comp16793_c2_seq1:284-1369(+)
MCVCVFAHACLPMPPAQIIYTPAEAGLIAPVSRSWGSFTKTHRPDFQYVIFDWDNIFASYIAAQHNDPAGYKFAQSNLIQVIKSSTAAGFVPNFSAGGTKSQDRTEPPIGATVLAKLFEKFNDTLLVRLLYPSLLRWNNWFAANRMPGPLHLVCLGSWNAQPGANGTDCNVMQDARFESGLDNSPMYDGNLFNRTTHQMQLYDVGMSSMVSKEAACLAQLAAVAGAPGDVSMLQQRALQLKPPFRRTCGTRLRACLSTSLSATPPFMCALVPLLSTGSWPGPALHSRLSGWCNHGSSTQPASVSLPMGTWRATRTRATGGFPASRQAIPLTRPSATGVAMSGVPWHSLCIGLLTSTTLFLA